MALIVKTTEADVASLHPSQQFQIYNALDCAVTHEVFGQIDPLLDPQRRRVYDFEFASQAPAWDMMRRGTLVDEGTRVELMNELRAKKKRVEYVLEALARAVWETGLNHNSPKQLKEFFYGVLGLEQQFIWEKGQKKVSTNRDSLEKLEEAYPISRPFVRAILKARDIDKKISVLESGVDPDGRMRFGFSVAATESGRWASNSNPFGTGTNAQNITEELRKIFISDPGMKLCYADLEQAESKVVAYDSQDENYIAACESGDLHTFCSTMIWPHLDWTGDLKQDKEIAERPFYRWFSHRDMSKRGGHLSNYFGKPWTMAKNLKLTREVAEEFQRVYFEAFPGIPRWWKELAGLLQSEGAIETPLGRKRIFFGRLDDDATLREAIAYRPQSTVADILNIALHRLWRRRRELGIQLLKQVHDAVLFQYPVEAEDEIIPAVMELMRVAVQIKGRTLIIPTEAKVGYVWNKSYMKKWTGNGSAADQKRPEAREEMSLLDKVFY